MVCYVTRWGVVFWVLFEVEVPRASFYLPLIGRHPG